MYVKISFNALYSNKVIDFNIEIDQYFPIDSSPNIDVWDSSAKILSKIKYMNYTSKTGNILLKSGGLTDITFGHGLLLNKYSNRYNYPLKNTYGISFAFNDNNFIDFQMFISDINHFSNQGGLLGLHSSIFISKKLPLKIGFGLVSDLNQFVNIESDYNILNNDSRSINSLQFDFSYNLLDRVNFDIKLVSEFFFNESHHFMTDD